MQPYYSPPPRRHSTVDITFTAILAAFAALVATGAVLFSFFFVMATDACGGSHTCNFDALGAAYVVTWGGIALAVVGGSIGIIVAAARNHLMWIWPAMSLFLIVVSTGIGVSLADSVLSHN